MIQFISIDPDKIMKMLAVAARFVFVVSTREKLCAVLMRLAVTLGVRAVLRRLTELLTWEKLIVW